MTGSATIAAPPPFRSPFVTVLAWLGIIFFGFSSVIGLLQSLMFRTMFQPGGPFDAMLSDSLPGPQMPHEMKFIFAHFQPFFLTYLACVVVGLVASIGLLHRRDWARMVFIALLAMNIAWSLVALFAGQRLMSGMGLPPAGTFPNAPDLAGMMRIMRVFMTVLSLATSVVCGWLIARLVSKPIRAEFVDGVA
jgi:hypothetical protein